MMIVVMFKMFNLLDAGVETQEINETQITQCDEQRRREPERRHEAGADQTPQAGADQTSQAGADQTSQAGDNQTGGNEAGASQTREVDSNDTQDQVNDTPPQLLSTTDTTTSDGDSSIPSTASENEAVQIGHKRREQFGATLAGYKHEKMKKKLAADAQMVHFAEKELELKERMFKQLENTSQEQAKTMNIVTSQLKELTNAMTGTFMLLQQSFQRPPTPQYPYHQYGSPYPPPPMPQRTLQFATPVRHSLSAESNTSAYDSQPLFDDENSFD